MLERLGNVLHWAGSGLSVIAIVGAVALSAWWQEQPTSLDLDIADMVSEIEVMRHNGAPQDVLNQYVTARGYSTADVTNYFARHERLAMQRYIMSGLLLFTAVAIWLVGRAAKYVLSGR